MTSVKSFFSVNKRNKTERKKTMEWCTEQHKIAKQYSLPAGERYRGCDNSSSVLYSVQLSSSPSSSSSSSSSGLEGWFRSINVVLEVSWDTQHRADLNNKTFTVIWGVENHWNFPTPFTGGPRLDLGSLI